jgi:general secretion pathway protein D
MKSTRLHSCFILIFVVMLATALPVAAQFRSHGSGGPTPASAASPATTNSMSENVGRLDFPNTPLQAVLDKYVQLNNRTLIVAPDVNLQKPIMLRCPTELTRGEALQALDSVLALHGISVLPLGEKFLKVVSITAAKQEGLQIGITEREKFPASDTIVAQVVKLRCVEVVEAHNAIQPLLHGGYGQLVDLPQSSSLLIIDTANNINQMLELLKHVDQSNELRMERKPYTLTHAKAADVVQRIKSVLQEMQQLKPKTSTPSTPAGAPVFSEQPPPATPAPAATPAGSAMAIDTKFILVPDERTSKIFAFSRGKDFGLIDELVREMDVKVDPEVTTRIIPLKNANADEVVAAVSSLIGGSGTGSTGASRSSSGSRTKKTSSSSSTISQPPATISAPRNVTGATGTADNSFLEFPESLRMSPDPRTNSILLLGTEKDLARLHELINDLDSPVAQVLIEVIIGEVELNNENDLGVDIVNRVIKGGPSSLYGGTSVIPGSQLPPNGIASPIGTTPQGAALSAALTYYATFRNLKLDVLVHALASTTHFRILSSPVIQTLHNQEGSIIVGASVPVATSTLSDVVSSGSSSTNQIASGLRANVEYKDVALELVVTPRINPNGLVTLDINQKVNDLGEDKNIGGIIVPTILKREAKSTVIVNDQSTIVLGGLIKNSKNVTDSKVPLLGDIPWLGWMFRSRKETTKREELIMFIRPVVLRNNAEAVAEAKRRAQMMDAGKELKLDNQFKDNTPTNITPNAVAPAVVSPKTETPTPVTEPKPRRGKTPSNVKVGK